MYFYSVAPPHARFQVSGLRATFPAESQVRKIFGTLINTHLMTFDEDIKPTGPLSLWGYMRYAGGWG